MKLPYIEHVDSGRLTAYEQFLKKEDLPVVTGYFIEDVTEVQVKPWKRMGVLGCYLNLGDQQQTDAYICEIPPGKETLPQRHLFEEIIYVVTGQGATTIWQEGTAKRTFEWSARAAFAIPLNASYQHFNVSKDEPVRLLGGTNCPHLFNLFHNEDFIFKNPFDFRDRFRDTEDFFRENKRLGVQHWETNFIPDINQFVLDEFPRKGKGVRIMRFSLADTTYGCHIQDFAVGSRGLCHRHGPGAVIIVTQGEGYVMLWREGEERKRYDFGVGTIYCPGDLMYHGHFNTGASPMRHFAMRGNSPKHGRGSRFIPQLYDMIPLEEEPPEVHREYLEELTKKGIKANVTIVQE